MHPFVWPFSDLELLSVFAINSLYVSLGSPPLPGWIPNGGDPCVEGWQGVQCVGPNITGMCGALLFSAPQTCVFHALV